MGREYDEKVDCWSCGVVMHLLLLDSFPYDAAKDEDLAHLIVECKLDFSKKKYKALGVQACSLL